MKTFTSVAQMKLAHLIAGQQVQTIVYANPGDRGGAEYLIEAAQAVDNINDHDLASATVAILQGPPSVVAAEIAAGVTPTDFSKDPGDILRYAFNTEPGVTDMTAAIRTSVSISSFAAGVVAGLVVGLPAEDILVTETITIATSGVNIIGKSREKTKIIFTPIAADTLFHFEDPGTSLVLCSLENVWLYSADTVFKKIAVSANDTTHFRFNNVRVGGAGPSSTWSGADSIGLEIVGRDTCSLYDIRIYADRPIVLSQSPNTAIVGIDHFNFHNCALLANANPVIEVLSDTLLSNVSFTGYQAWLKGTHGFYWNDTATVGSSVNLRFENVRTEQGTDATAYTYYIASNSSLQGLSIVNSRMDITKKGIFVRNASLMTVSDTEYGGALEALNVDGVTSMTLNNILFQVGSTVSIVGLVEKLSFGDRQAGQPIPDTSFWSTEGVSFQAQVGMKVFGTEHWSFQGVVEDDGQINIPASATRGRTVAIITVGAYSAVGPIEEGGIVLGTPNSGILLSNTTNFVLGNVDTKLCYLHQSQPIIFNRTGQAVDMVIDVVWKN